MKRSRNSERNKLGALEHCENVLMSVEMKARLPKESWEGNKNNLYGTIIDFIILK